MGSQLVNRGGDLPNFHRRRLVMVALSLALFVAATAWTWPA